MQHNALVRGDDDTSICTVELNLANCGPAPHSPIYEHDDVTNKVFVRHSQHNDIIQRAHFVMRNIFNTFKNHDYMFFNNTSSREPLVLNTNAFG